MAWALFAVDSQCPRTWRQTQNILSVQMCILHPSWPRRPFRGVAMPVGVAGIAIGIDNDPEHVITKELPGNRHEPRILEQAGKERRVFIHHHRPVALNDLGVHA